MTRYSESCQRYREVHLAQVVKDEHKLINRFYWEVVPHCLAMYAQMLEAVAFLQGLRIIHHDLKPDNFFVNLERSYGDIVKSGGGGKACSRMSSAVLQHLTKNPFPHVVVADFGEASVLPADECGLGERTRGEDLDFAIGWSQSGTGGEKARGAIELQPPEMALQSNLQDRAKASFDRRKGVSIGLQADVWGCGVLFFHVLTGGAPFTEGEVMAFGLNRRLPIVQPKHVKKLAYSSVLEKFLRTVLVRDMQNRPSIREVQSVFYSDLLPEFLSTSTGTTETTTRTSSTAARGPYKGIWKDESDTDKDALNYANSAASNLLSFQAVAQAIRISSPSSSPLSQKAASASQNGGATGSGARSSALSFSLSTQDLHDAPFLRSKKAMIDESERIRRIFEKPTLPTVVVEKHKVATRRRREQDSRIIENRREQRKLIAEKKFGGSMKDRGGGGGGITSGGGGGCSLGLGRGHDLRPDASMDASMAGSGGGGGLCIENYGCYHIETLRCGSSSSSSSSSSSGFRTLHVVEHLQSQLYINMDEDNDQQQGTDSSFSSTSTPMLTIEDTASSGLVNLLGKDCRLCTFQTAPPEQIVGEDGVKDRQKKSKNLHDQEPQNNISNTQGRQVVEDKPGGPSNNSRVVHPHQEEQPFVYYFPRVVASQVLLLGADFACLPVENRTTQLLLDTRRRVYYCNPQLVNVRAFATAERQEHHLQDHAMIAKQKEKQEDVCVFPDPHKLMGMLRDDSFWKFLLLEQDGTETNKRKNKDFLILEEVSSFETASTTGAMLQRRLLARQDPASYSDGKDTSELQLQTIRSFESSALSGRRKSLTKLGFSAESAESTGDQQIRGEQLQATTTDEVDAYTAGACGAEDTSTNSLASTLKNAPFPSANQEAREHLQLALQLPDLQDTVLHRSSASSSRAGGGASVSKSNASPIVADSFADDNLYSPFAPFLVLLLVCCGKMSGSCLLTVEQTLSLMHSVYAWDLDILTSTNNARMLLATVTAYVEEYKVLKRKQQQQQQQQQVVQSVGQGPGGKEQQLVTGNAQLWELLSGIDLQVVTKF
ncbi:unnamed protein product [Amoebophrya sp. A25]|nr:unnamed protein product [Amoebophrya sp. A25]|eukprot:GSA25T00012938001.1